MHILPDDDGECVECCIIYKYTEIPQEADFLIIIYIYPSSSPQSIRWTLTDAPPTVSDARRLLGCERNCASNLTVGLLSVR